MASSGSSGHLVEDFDGAFQNCLAAITKQEHFNVNDSEETKNSVDQCVQRFVDIAKQLESFFLQKRLMLSIHKPEQVLKEDITELKLELQRKDQLLNKHHEKLQHWQTILSRQQQTQQQQQNQGQTQQQSQQQTPQNPNQGQTQPQTPIHSQGQGQSPGQAAMGTGMSGTPTGPQPVHQGVQRSHPLPQAIQQVPQLQQQHSQPGMVNHPSPGMGMGVLSGGTPAMGLSHPPQLQHQASFPQGPLAYLEQTTSNIGMPERR